MQFNISEYLRCLDKQNFGSNILYLNQTESTNDLTEDQEQTEQTNLIGEDSPSTESANEVVKNQDQEDKNGA